MAKKNVHDFFKDKKQILTIDYLYARNKGKGITKSFIELLVYQNQNEVIKLLNSAKSFEDFKLSIKNNLEKICARSSVFLTYITGGSLELYDGHKEFIPLDMAKNFIKNDFSKEELKLILELYKDVIIEYINNHKDIKHRVSSSSRVVDGSCDALVTDFTEEFDDKNFAVAVDLLFKEAQSFDEIEAKKVLSTIISEIGSLYDKDFILNNIAFVKFEIQYGYFDKYITLLRYRKDIPSIEERMRIFEEQRSITNDQQYRLEQLDLLEKRISSLNDEKKEIFLDKIRLICEESDIKVRARLIDECFEYYESQFRKEIVDSAFSPANSLEVSDFSMLNPALLHIFIRNPMVMLDSYRDELKKEIIAARGVKVTGQEELTPTEMEEYQSKIDYAINVLLNPVITSKSLDKKTLYSDSSGLRLYTSDTTNQISLSLFSPEILMHLSNCVGVGFDKNGIRPENIIISSSSYQTTNMGVDNLEVSPEYRFMAFSAPLEELSKFSRTEIVMYRDNNGITTDASYVFAVINGYDEAKDKETLDSAREYAVKNNIKMVVFNIKKLKQSYEAMFQAEENVEEVEKGKVK